jgi:hypothetical protein
MQLRELLINSDVDYFTNESATGFHSFSSGLPENNFLFEGDREGGSVYQILNFADGAFKFSGLWRDLSYNNKVMRTRLYMCGTIDEELMPNHTSVMCNVPIYRDGSTELPSDSPPDIILYMNAGLKYLLYALAIISVFPYLVSLVLFVLNPTSKTVKNSQPFSIMVIILGACFASISIFLVATEPDSSICIGIVWFENLAYVLIFNSIFVKMWRIHKIVNNKTLKRMKISWVDILKIVAAQLALVVVLLAIATGTSSFDIEYEYSVSQNQRYLKPTCSGVTAVSMVFFNIIYFYQLATLVVCIYYVYLIRHVPPAVNETSALVSCLSASVFIIIAAVVLILALNLDPFITRLIRGLCYFSVLANIFSSLFLPKIVNLWEEYQEGRQVVDLKYKKSNTSTTDFEKDVNFVEALKHLKSLRSVEERMKLCYHMVSVWQVALVKIATEVDNSENRESKGMSMIGGDASQAYTVTADDNAFSSDGSRVQT